MTGAKIDLLAVDQGLNGALAECQQLADELLELDRDGSIEFFSGFLDLFDGSGELLCIEPLATPRAGECGVTLKPGNRLIEFLTALRARKTDFDGVNTGTHRGALL